MISSSTVTPNVPGRLRERIGSALILLALLSCACFHTVRGQNTALRVSSFDIDVTPTRGVLSYDTLVNTWDMGLRAKGIVLLGSGRPVVLCAIDWLAISNEGMDDFKQRIASEVGTSPTRVSVHVVHQHDAPRYDAGAEAILRKAGIDPAVIHPTAFDGTFPRSVIPRLAGAVAASIPNARPVTHFGIGKANVTEVASNRHIYGHDGKVRYTRMSSTKDPAARAEPEGLIDPELSLVSFWNEETPVAVLSFYACHPQSYYRTGIPNPDFPGIARFLRQLQIPQALHVHFNGAGGNIAAGKYNDGSHENRLKLAQRMEEGMRKAWEATVRHPVRAGDLDWLTCPVHLAPAPHLQKISDELARDNEWLLKNNSVAGKMAWLARARRKLPVEAASLRLGNQGYVLFMPGELFVEYQLAAKATRPDKFVAMAAYGDLGMGYIGTAAAYEKGGYEVGPLISGVDGRAETVLKQAIEKLLPP